MIDEVWSSDETPVPWNPILGRIARDLLFYTDWTFEQSFRHVVGALRWAR